MLFFPLNLFCLSTGQIVELGISLVSEPLSSRASSTKATAPFLKISQTPLSTPKPQKQVLQVDVLSWANVGLQALHIQSASGITLYASSCKDVKEVSYKKEGMLGR
jgi:hypothetical protein